ncbi:MAG TPA: helix-turn-helix transcriptional regulator [Acidobacteriota bacterium]|nr:helix-turn-helix transcriptional regulator [Acidobacteriota bacterium]
MSNDPVNDLVIRFLRHERLKHGLQVRQICAISGIPLGSYSSLETGRYRLTPGILLRAQLALGCSIERLWPFGTWTVGPVTDDLIRTIVAEAEKRLPVPPTIEDVVEAVYHTTGIGSRRRGITEARAIAAYPVSRTPELILNDLARAMDMNPSSLSHSIVRLEKRAAHDEHFRALLKTADKWFKRVLREE